MYFDRAEVRVGVAPRRGQAPPHRDAHVGTLVVMDRIASIQFGQRESPIWLQLKWRLSRSVVPRAEAELGNRYEDVGLKTGSAKELQVKNLRGLAQEMSRWLQGDGAVTTCTGTSSIGAAGATIWDLNPSVEKSSAAIHIKFSSDLLRCGSDTVVVASDASDSDSDSDDDSSLHQRGSKRGAPEESGSSAAAAAVVDDASSSSSSSEPAQKKVKPEAAEREQIRFFRETDPAFGFLSNFHVHKTPIVYEHKEYRTAEALYQALKFLQDDSNKANLDLAEAIRTQNTPYQSKIIAGGRSGRYKWQQALAGQHATFVRAGAKFPDDWHERRLDVMSEVLALKFEQDEECAERLLDTGDAALIEASPFDSFWGVGRDGRGENRLGMMLEQIRTITECRLRPDDDGES